MNEYQELFLFMVVSLLVLIGLLRCWRLIRRERGDTTAGLFWLLTIIVVINSVALKWNQPYRLYSSDSLWLSCQLAFWPVLVWWAITLLSAIGRLLWSRLNNSLMPLTLFLENIVVIMAPAFVSVWLIGIIFTIASLA